MRLLFIAFVGLIGMWLGWYYGAAVGYSIWPESEWVGAVFSYAIGMPIGTLAAIWLATKAVQLSRKISSPR